MPLGVCVRYRKGRGKPAADRYELRQAVTGDTANMRQRSAGGLDTGWVCGKPFHSVWRGDDTQVQLAPDLTTLDFYAGASSGLFGTTTPVSPAHIAVVCPGLVK
jgi:hypothetical protein